MTAELKRCWIKNARWCEGGTTFLMDGARRVHERAEETAFIVDLAVIKD
jgi:hypothetical protein